MSVPSPPQARKCAGNKKNGKPCNSYAIEGSRFCIMHDPRKSSQRSKWRRKGANVRNGLDRQALDEDAPDVELGSIRDVIRLIQESISQVRRGQISTKIASTIGYLGGIALRALEQTTLEEIGERLEALEKAIAEKGK